MQMDLSAALLEGVRLFNDGEFFLAHEVLEDAWRSGPAADKQLLQGLVQIAVAFHHHSTGNRVGALSVLKKAQQNLKRAPTNFYGIEVGSLLADLHELEKLLAVGGEGSMSVQIQMKIDPDKHPK